MYKKVEYPVVTDKGNLKQKVRTQCVNELYDRIGDTLEDLGYDKISPSVYTLVLEDPQGNLLHLYLQTKASLRDIDEYF